MSITTKILGPALGLAILLGLAGLAGAGERGPLRTCFKPWGAPGAKYVPCEPRTFFQVCGRGLRNGEAYRVITVEPGGAILARNHWHRSKPHRRFLPGKEVTVPYGRSCRSWGRRR